MHDLSKDRQEIMRLLQALQPDSGTSGPAATSAATPAGRDADRGGGRGADDDADRSTDPGGRRRHSRREELPLIRASVSRAKAVLPRYIRALEQKRARALIIERNGTPVACMVSHNAPPEDK